MITIGSVILIGSLAVNFGGVTLEGELLAAGGALAIFIFALIGSFRASGPSGNRVLLIPAALLLTGVLVSLFSPLPAAGRVELARLVSAALLLAAFLLLRLSDSSRLLFHLSALLLGAGLVLYGIRLRGGVGLAGEPLTATYVNRNHFAALLGLILPPAICFSFISRPKCAAWFSRSAVPVLLGGILLTKSRGGIMGTAASISFLCLVYLLGSRPGRESGHPAVFRKRRVLIAVLLILSLGAVALYLWFRAPESFPISAPHPDVLSIRTRLSIWRSTLEIFLARPLTGWGWGTFRYLYPSFKEAEVWYTVPHAHNEFLQLLAEGGVAGFSLVVFSLVLAFWKLVKRYSISSGSVSGVLALGAAGSIISAAVHSGFDFIFRLPANVLLLSVLVGLALSAGPGQLESLTSTRRRPVILVPGLLLAVFLVIFLYLPLFRSYRSEEASREGERLLATGWVGEAREAFTRAQQLDPSSCRPLLGRAAVGVAEFDRAKDKIGLYASIVADLENCRRNNPWDTLPLRRLSQFHQDLSALEKAGSYLEEAIAIGPVNPYLYYELAGNDLKRGDYLSAARNLCQASSIYICIWPSSLKLISRYTNDYEILKELPPPGAEFHRDLGYHLQAADNPDGAEEEFGRALELAPDDPENWRGLGLFLARTGRLEEAERCYRQALALTPRNHQWLMELGDLLRKLDMIEEALDLYLQARELKPTCRNYAEKVGAAILSLKGREEAISFWGSVADDNPGWPSPYSHRAQILLESGRPAEAEKEIDLAIVRQPDNRHYARLKSRIEAILQRGINQ